MRIVIIATLAIIVMLVLVGIFSNKINFFSDNAMDCISKGGHCANGCSVDEITILRTSCNFDENMGNDKCCILGG